MYFNFKGNSVQVDFLKGSILPLNFSRSPSQSFSKDLMSRRGYGCKQMSELLISHPTIKSCQAFMFWNGHECKETLKKTMWFTSWKPFVRITSQKETYCEITFIRGVPIFVVFVGRLIHEIKDPTNNETWEAARHRYIGKCCPRVTLTFWTSCIS